MKIFEITHRQTNKKYFLLTAVFTSFLISAIAIPIIESALDDAFWLGVGDDLVIERSNGSVRVTLQKCDQSASGGLLFYNATVSGITGTEEAGLNCSPFSDVGTDCGLENSSDYRVECARDDVSYSDDQAEYSLSTCTDGFACDCYDRFVVNISYGPHTCPYMVVDGDSSPEVTYWLGDVESDYGEMIPLLDSTLDADTICDDGDNCPLDDNEDQADADSDYVGDVCDNCPDDSNADQSDTDSDTVGDICDNCNLTGNPDQADADNDSFGDLCDCAPGDPDPVASKPIYWYEDGDGDGWGGPSDPVLNCSTSGMPGYANRSGDCNDENASINPGAVEVCDLADNDCDGNIDEGLGNTSCGVGACNHTIDFCVDGEVQECDPMEGASDEMCDDIDNDCDGDTDEDFADLGTFCESDGIGVCYTNGSMVCADNASSTVCDAETVGPVNETCDNLDNDCDGETDEDVSNSTQACGLGACASGNQSGACVAGAWAWSACSTANLSSAEVCKDGIDNDCDGSTDEGCAGGDSSGGGSGSSSGSRGGGSGGFMQILGEIELPEPEIPEEPEQGCNCTNDSVEISFIGADNGTVNITVTKLDDCEHKYVLLVTNPSLLGEKVFTLSEEGDTASFNLVSENRDWIELKARLYCWETYVAGNIGDYIDIKTMTRELKGKLMEPTISREINPTGLATGGIGVWWLGLILIVALLMLLFLLKQRKDRSSD